MDFTSRGAITSSGSGARRTTSGARFGQSGSDLALASKESRLTMAKSAMSVRAALARPFGDVEPINALPGAALSLITAAKSLAIWLAVRSTGSERTANGFNGGDCVAGLTAAGGDCGSSPATIAAFAGPTRAV